MDYDIDREIHFREIMKNKVKHHLFSFLNWKSLLLVVFVLCTFIFFHKNQFLFQAIVSGDIQSIKDFIGKNQFSALLLSTFIMIVQNTFTIIPLLLVITINITFLGFIKGFLWSWFTSIIAAAVIFYFVRYFFQALLIEKVDKELVKKVENRGFLYVFEARIMPFVPTSLVNILSGLSSIRFTSFLFATLFGNFIYFFILALIPAGLLTSSLSEYLLGAAFLLFLTLFYFYKRKKGGKRNPPSSTEKQNDLYQ